MRFELVIDLNLIRLIKKLFGKALGVSLLCSKVLANELVN